VARVLIAEDEKSFRVVFPRFLSAEGHEVRTAENGQLAIEVGRQFQPDVLIADWMLDDITGLDVAEALQSEMPELRVIFITGFSSVELESKAARRNLRHYLCLEKPFRIEEVIEVVQRSVAKRDP
jgi:DNA-binding NtrC family response regulator